MLLPQDEHNRNLESFVHPPDWQNPRPHGKYNLVVIGGGTAGLVSAVGAAGLGAKVAIVERGLLGGDCLNVGCVPSKSVISSARVASTLERAKAFGVEVPAGWAVDFSAVMERMRRLRAGIAPHDSAQRLAGMGIDVFLGSGRFTARDTLQVADDSLRFRSAVIATGARAALPPIPGLVEARPLTNETVFSLTSRPTRMAVIGGGPIGSELAQAFARLGTQVVQIEKTDRILGREDPEAARIVQHALERDGVEMVFSAETLRVDLDGPEKVLQLRHQGKSRELRVDEILVGAGRTPNVEGMGLETIGIEFDLRQGVLVNDRLQTNLSHIYAAGDVCSRYKFTHAADFMARLVIRNALFLGRAKASSLTIPWCTYTSPEVAHVGLHEHEARSRGMEIDTFRQDFAEVDRAILDGDGEGFVKIHVRRGKDEIVGATIVATNAGDMISEITLAMQHGIGLGKDRRYDPSVSHASRSNPQSWRLRTIARG